MARVTKGSVVLFALALLSLCFFLGLLTAKPRGPIIREVASGQNVYAYRGWQRTRYTIGPGDVLVTEAAGKWMYSPAAGPNGPEGHPVFLSPASYPLPGVNGGALIGKIGEAGQPFYVGRKQKRTISPNDSIAGPLYLRIDDDLLGDNRGYVSVQIDIVSPD